MPCVSGEPLWKHIALSEHYYKMFDRIRHLMGSDALIFCECPRVLCLKLLSGVVLAVRDGRIALKARMQSIVYLLNFPILSSLSSGMGHNEFMNILMFAMFLLVCQIL